MMRDYKPPRRAYAKRAYSPPKRRRPFWLLILGLALCAGLFLNESEVTQATSPPPAAPLSVAEPAPAEEAAVIPEIVRQDQQGKVKHGDTISALLGEYLSTQQILQLSRDSKETFPLSGLCAGQPYQLSTIDGQFDRFLYDIDSNEQLQISKGAESFEIARIPIAYEVKPELVKGTITSSLFNAVEVIGEEAVLAINLADIFAWDIDFILDIREGDSFRAVVEKRFRDGQPAGYGQILAAEFINQGQSYHAILFQDGRNKPDYYDLEGKNLRKAFLKAPLSFTRISSGYTMKRFHPITKNWKSHPAIDYVAPTGTPIKTVGDGTVVRRGYSRGNGNFAEIRHTNGYTTIYLHMSKFAKGISKGSRLTQGQVIGYVGATGLATGPHLCFRMRKEGKPVNPNTVRITSAPSVAKENMAQFLALAAPLRDQLAGAPVRQAKNDSAARSAPGSPTAPPM